MAQQSITHLLIVSDGFDAANRLISSLRSAGLVLRTGSAASVQELAGLLSQGQWDVVVCYDNERIPPAELLKLMARHELELPALLVTSSGNAFQPGFRDVIAADQDRQLLVSVQREAGFQQLKRQHRQLELRYRELEKRHELILGDSATAVSYLQDGVHLYCNESYARCFGYDSASAIAPLPFLNLVATDERPRVRQLLSGAMPEETSETLSMRRLDGSEEKMLLSFTPVEYQGQPCLQLSILPAAGNAEHTAALARIQTQDLLTRLDNHSHFSTRIESAIRKAVNEGVSSSVLLVEIDEFVDISSAIGKSNANIVLNDIALFLQEVIGKPYAAARLDEHVFGILLYEGDPDEALALAGVIRSRISNRISPAMLSTLELNCSIGMAMINPQSLDADDVLGRARHNLRQALAGGGGSHQFHIGENLRHDAGDMLDYLKTALQERRFKLLYQPLVHIKGEGHKRYEVLLRMLDAAGNEMAPGSFLPLANANGMGESIDTLVAGMALDAIAAGTAQRLIINLTSNTLANHTFLPWLSEKLRAERIPADSLVLQLSEINIHNSLAQALEFSRGMRELNLGLSISRFGCALDPFAILDKIGPEFVKLDESLVRNIIYSPQQKAALQNLIRKLHARGLAAVIPQVENMDALPVLWETGADYVQGYCLQGPSDEMNYEFVLVEEITLPAAQG